MCNKVFIVHVDEMMCDINIPLDVVQIQTIYWERKAAGWGVGMPA